MRTRQCQVGVVDAFREVIYFRNVVCHSVLLLVITVICCFLVCCRIVRIVILLGLRIQVLCQLDASEFNIPDGLYRIENLCIDFSKTGVTMPACISRAAIVLNRSMSARLGIFAVT